MRFLLQNIFLSVALSTAVFAQKTDELWLAPACKPKLFGLEHGKGGLAVEAKYTMLVEQDGNAWIAQVGGKFGVIDSKGEWLMKPDYEYLVQYSHGKAVCGKKMPKRYSEVDPYYEESYNDSAVYLGVIDESGTWVVEAAYDFLQLADDGTLLYTDVHGKYGFLNPDGTILVRAQYDYASLMSDGVAVIAEQSLKPGYEQSMYYSPSGRYAYRAGSYFLIDRTGQKLNTQPYDLIRQPDGGRAAFNKGGVWKQKYRYSERASLTGGKWGFLDASGKEVIAPVYDYVYDFRNGKAKVRLGEKTFWIDKDGKECAPPESSGENEFKVFCEPGFFGYIDPKGNWVIEPQFFAAEDFSEGLAAAMALKASDMNCEDKENDRLYNEYYDDLDIVGPRINLLGLGRKYRYEEDEPENQVMLLGGNPKLDSLEKPSRRLYGYIDTSGNMIIPAKFETAFPFKEGRAYVCFRGKWGVIDRQGNWIMMPVLDWPNRMGSDDAYLGYSWLYNDRKPTVNRGVSMSDASIYMFSEGMGGIWKNNKCGFIDTAGKIIVPPIYDEARPFSQGLAAVRHGEKWGFIDKTGREVIPLKFSYVYSFTEEGLVIAGAHPTEAGLPKPEDGMKYEEGDDLYYGFLDKTGKWVIQPRYTSASSFSEGLAAVEEEYGRVGYIDKTGKFIIPAKYDYGYSFHNGYAYVKMRLYEPVYIDKTGKVSKVYTVKNPPVDKTQPVQFRVDSNLMIGFVNEKGDVVIPYIFESAGSFVKVR